MDESGQGVGDQGASRSEGGLGELAQILLDNPWFHQALQVAVEARDRASAASQQAMRGLNVPSAGDVERLERRLRAVSERLESVEDQLDALTRELRELRRPSTPPRG